LPEVSVVIPSYNHAAYIGQAVESVLRQTFADLELIVIEDGSTDNSLEILSRFSDPRIQVIAQDNQGAHAAINRGLRQASGEYLAILNSDDAYHPQRLEKILAVLKTDPQVGLAGSYIQIVDQDGKPGGIKHAYHDCPPWLLEKPERSFGAGEDLQAALLTENYLATSSNYVFPRRTFEQVGDFLPLRYTHDWDFALRATRAAKLAVLPEPLVSYRIHKTNTIRENRAAMVFEICWILAVHLPAFTSPGVSEQRVDQLLHSIYTYGLDRVLSVMLLQRLSDLPEQAKSLLQPDNPVRGTYLQFISDTLLSMERAGRQVPDADRRRPKWKALLLRILSPILPIVRRT
jgi:GT2 family glycosyltransferase